MSSVLHRSSHSELLPSMQALQALPCSPDIWIHLISRRRKAGASPSAIRNLLEVATRRAGKAWDSTNLWKFFALCELQSGDTSAAISVLLRAVKMPIGGLAEILEELRKYLDMYKPRNEVLVLEEAEPSQELLDSITCRRQFEEKIEKLGGSEVTKAEIVTWKAYLDYMKEHSIRNNENVEDTERLSEVQALFERCMDIRVFQQDIFYRAIFYIRRVL